MISTQTDGQYVMSSVRFSFLQFSYVHLSLTCQCVLMFNRSINYWIISSTVYNIELIFFFIISAFRHSCSPNTSSLVYQSTASIFTTKPIKQGEEVSILWYIFRTFNYLYSGVYCLLKIIIYINYSRFLHHGESLVL